MNPEDQSRPTSGSLTQRLRRLIPWPRPSGGGARGPDPARIAADRYRTQVRIIRDAFGGDIAAAPTRGPRPVRDDADASYLYRPSHALVREEDVDRLERYLADRGADFRGGLDRTGEPLPGLVSVVLPRRTDGGDAVLATLEEIDRDLGPGLVTPDHVLHVSARVRLCPATEPQEPEGRAPAPFPGLRSDPSIGQGVRVAVVDTGLWQPAVTSKVTPWLDGVQADQDDLEVVDPKAIHPYGGHGTFVSGILRCVAPGTRVEVEGALTQGGAVYESELIAQFKQALEEEDRPQLISISAGTYTRKAMALLSFEMLASTYGLDDGEQTLIIAAAGNDGSKEPFWPAAFPWVAAVGSVDPDGKVSDYSNHGPWVDVFARGRDLVNAFPKGVYTCYEPPNVGQVRTFDGLARWSGTSFSTPIVTGLVAARMSATGESALAALKAILGSGTASNDPKAGSAPTVGPLT